ncbi:MAG: hypothetical protein ABH869_02195 [Candidatus Omnitrophota bacterium]
MENNKTKNSKERKNSYMRGKSSKLTKGFTLVEIFLVASLLGGLMLTIFSVYASGIKIWRTIKDIELIKDRKFIISFEKIKRELSGYIRNYSQIEFEGSSDKIVFPYVRGKDILKITYEFDKNDRVLKRKTVKLTGALKDEMDEETADLLDADDVEISYFYYDDLEKTGSWIGTFYESENGSPEIIKFNFSRGEKKFDRFVFIPR